MSAGPLIVAFIITLIVVAGGVAVWLVMRKTMRETKNYERGLKMVPIHIHLPPPSDDTMSDSRDKRDLTEEVLSQSEVMYNIIASTATKGFKSSLYGQRHMAFEIVSRDGLIYYYAVVPVVLLDVVKQAIAAAYPSARLEEKDEHNIFSRVGKLSAMVGGEFTLKKDYHEPIATYLDTKKDSARALLEAISKAGREDGVGIQILLRPAKQGWDRKARTSADKIVSDKMSGKSKKGMSAFINPRDILEALWKAPNSGDKDKSPGDMDRKELNSTEKALVEAIHEKAKYPGYEVLIRVIVSSNVASKAQGLMSNIVASFSLFDSASHNGFKFTPVRNIDDFATAFIFRFFPQAIDKNILNSVELATIFHLPDQGSIPNSQVKRQMTKQVDGPTEVMDQGMLLGYNEYRGVKKPIRISDKDRRRHMHIIGQTGVGKSVLQENLAYQDMMDGRGFAFLDPHGDSVEALLSRVPPERVEDIIYFNPSDLDNPIGLNMFEFDHPDEKDFLVQEAISMLYGLYDPGHTGIVGPRLEHIFRNCALLLMADPKGGTFIDIPKLLVDQDFMKSKLKYVTDQQVLDFWTKEFPASQRSNEAGEVISWVVSKFGPFISNDMMRNIIGQTKSGFNIPDVMNNKKILLVNLSKGKMGDLNSKLIGIVFVMKFQAAAMARAKMPEEERKDFTLYVDEFQNFATDSFETILSEARKYRLSLIMGNQFMTQLKDELREAILGNVGTTITGRIGITDAEIMVKRYQPVFDADDLTKIPNYQSVCVAQINGVPSSAFSMSWVPPMGHANKDLMEGLVKLSASKYARPRGVVEKEIFDRISPPQEASKQLAADAKPKGTGSSFLDDWLSKRKQLGGRGKAPAPVASAPRQLSPKPMQSAAPVQTQQQALSASSIGAASPAVAQQPIQRPSSVPTQSVNSQPYASQQQFGQGVQSPALKNPKSFSVGGVAQQQPIVDLSAASPQGLHAMSTPSKQYAEDEPRLMPQVPSESPSISKKGHAEEEMVFKIR